MIPLVKPRRTAINLFVGFFIKNVINPPNPVPIIPHKKPIHVTANSLLNSLPPDTRR
jgi:hypothetical protein